jgi:frataxin-like iron-binding protein CyaY
MNIESHRKSIIHRILDVQNEQILDKIDQLLNEEGYIYDVSGKLLSVEAYKKEVEDILKASEEDEVYNSDVIRNKIFKKCNQ